MNPKDIDAHVAGAQRELVEAMKKMKLSNKLSIHLPEYKELEQLLIRLANLGRAVRKLDL